MSEEVKRMAELLREGAKMLSSTCPECGTILFKVGENTICPKCNRKIIISKDDDEKMILDRDVVLRQVEQSITKKIDQVQKRLSGNDNPKELQDIATLLSIFLEILERIKRIQASH